jgi:hypothetical protein
MMGTMFDTDHILFEAKNRRRELEAAAERARQVREARGRRRVRRQLGGWLIAAGEALRWEECGDAA